MYVSPDGENVDLMIRDVGNELIDHAFSWFNRFDDIDEVRRTLLEDEEKYDATFGFGGNPCPTRNYLLGYVSLKIDDLKMAEVYLNEVIKSNTIKTDRLTDDIEAIAKGINPIKQL